MKQTKWKAFFLVALALITGCQNMDHYRRERVAKADRAFTKIRSEELPKDAVLTLPFCIDTALKRNLNLKVYQLREAVNNEQKTAAALGMLPDVIVSNDLSERNNKPGASSKSLITGRQSLEPSQSVESWENRVRVEFLFSFIDFGLSYFKAVQTRDRTLITSEQQRRAAQNLIFDVARAYFKVAAAQYAMEHTERMLKISDETEKLLETMVKNRKMSMETIISEKKTFLILKKSLMEYRRNYENSCIELKSLMGYYPRHHLVVDTSCMKEQTLLKIPDVELLEEIALLERPELYQLDIQKHITAIEARKTIIEMFPNVGIFVDFTNSTNTFLYNKSWWELGVRAAYRLLRIPQKMMKYSALEMETEQVDMQVKALSVGIISQVRIAHANLADVEQRYNISKKLYDTYLEHQEIKEKHAQTAGMLSRIELNRIRMETAQKNIERTQALGNYYLAYFRLLNAIGLNSMTPENFDTIRKRVIRSFTETEYEETQNLLEYNREKNELNKTIAECNKQIVELKLTADVPKGKINGIDTKIQQFSDAFKKDEEGLLKKFQAKSLSLDKRIIKNKTRIKELERELSIKKMMYEIEVAQKKKDYEERMSIYNDGGKVQAEILAAFEKKRSNDLEKAEQEHKKTIALLKDKIKNCKNQVIELDDQVNNEKKLLEKTIYKLRENFDENVNVLADSKDKHVETLDDYKKQIAKYVDKLTNLEDEKADLIKKISDSQSIINEHNTKLVRYVSAIGLLRDEIDKTSSLVLNRRSKKDLLTKNKNRFKDTEVISKKIDEIAALKSPETGIKKIEKSKPKELSPRSNLTMQVQGKQTKDSTISFEGFQPEATKNIDMQTQSDAGTAKIPIQAYDPETQSDITIQTLKDADNTQIDFQEYGSEFRLKQDKIGN